MLDIMKVEQQDGRLDTYVSGRAEEVSDSIILAVWSVNYENLAGIVDKVMSNGGRFSYDVFAGPSGVRLECCRLKPDHYRVSVLYRAKNSVSYRNALSLDRAIYARLNPQPEAPGHAGRR